MISSRQTQVNNYGPGPQILNNSGPVNNTVIVIANGITYTQDLALVKDLLKDLYNVRENSILPVPDWRRLSRTHFCLFVLDNGVYDAGVFAIAKTRALEYTPDREKYRHLGPLVIDEILKMPCIFAKRNSYYKLADKNVDVLLGRVTDIIKQEATITFRFEVYSHFPQQIINDNLRYLDILGNDLMSQLDREHWSIRNGDLIKKLEEIGVIKNEK